MSDLVCISEGQRKLHIASEAVAVAVVAPFTFWVGSQHTGWTRRALYAIGFATLAVDGYLLAQYLQQR